MLRFIATLLLALTSFANAGTFGECSCKFKDGHVQKFQVSDCKASACYIECRQNAGGVQESCITKNQDSINLPGPGICQCGKARYAVSSCESAECFNYCDKPNLGHGVCVTKSNSALTMALSPAWPSINNFATSGVPFSDCSSPGHLLQVYFVSINPNPPIKGQKVDITISGNLDTDISAANAQLQVSLGNFQVLNQNFQLSGAAAGPVSQTVNILVPGFAPNGAYTAKSMITSGDQQLACITVNFNLGSNNIALAQAISCEACLAKFADLPADDQANICNKVLKCVPATPAPIVIPCDKCLAKLADDLPADDAAFVCNKLIKCKPAVQTMAGGDGAVLG